MERREFCASLLAGGTAGMCVDLILFPLDTIKTRLQSPLGFSKSGGFRGIYAGVPSTAVGSFPNAAAFFVTYESAKQLLHSDSSYLSPIIHMAAASLGEVVACLIRVPSEVIKQRAQVSPSSTTYQMLSATLRQEGIKGLYRGYKSTVLREIPFSLVQFPLWESLKDLWSWKQGRAVDSWQSAVCGAFAGGFAAALTTPLDVAKTRIMLAKVICRSYSQNDSNQSRWIHFPRSLRQSPDVDATRAVKGIPWTLSNFSRSPRGPQRPPNTGILQHKV
ncbi:S-adenosylmethionine mitochondrial carrier protein isoform X1 [Xenopus tropicalis]|uniref:Mitochondrial S-adenosylmethionine carrier protein n=1 Tax=Xenopus tropicalis TaxID=8364 RepID=A0A8J1JFP8_XENTR|nr:S-adenosylmethionine mitochondrial carrier protein isoform X1 [Xenopus tropicalis]